MQSVLQQNLLQHSDVPARVRVQAVGASGEAHTVVCAHTLLGEGVVPATALLGHPDCLEAEVLGDVGPEDAAGAKVVAKTPSPINSPRPTAPGLDCRRAPAPAPGSIAQFKQKVV